MYDLASITIEEVKRIADMVRITISDEEANQYTNELSEIISYAGKLTELNTDDVEATTHGIVLTNVMRNDEVIQTITQEDVLNNAPDQQDGHFRVPRIMEE